MVHSHRIVGWLVSLAILFCIFFTGCRTDPSANIGLRPSDGLQPDEQYFLGYLVSGILKDEQNLADYFQGQSDQALNLSAPREALLVYYPVILIPVDGYPEYRFDYDHPLITWIIRNGRLFRQEDPKLAVAQFNDQHLNIPHYRFSIYHFGIIDLDLQAGSADLIYSLECGPTCGWLYTLHFKKDSQGYWGQPKMKVESIS